MDIVILGAGNVGRALAGAWAKEGHNVMLAVRDANRADFEDLEGEGVVLIDAKESAKSADVVVVAVPWNAVAGALKDAGPLKGKIVIDATNPLTADLSLAVGLRYNFRDTIAAVAEYRLISDKTDYMTPAGDDPSYLRHELVAGIRAAL